MFSSNVHDRTILEISKAAFLGITIESFLVDRRAAGLSPQTLKFYRPFITPFLTYCDSNAVKHVEEVTPDLLRRYFLAFAETHNPGGVHASFRSLRAFFRWLVDEDMMPPDWKNPMLKVKPPKVAMEPLEPVAIQDVKALIAGCSSGTIIDDRDRAVFLVLLDTGLRAQELCDIHLEDVDLNRGGITVRYGKGGKTRTVFIGKKARKALRAYLRHRADREQALFLSRDGERVSYDALRLMLKRRAKQAGPSSKPTLHAFRRAFALNMLRNGADVFALQKLLGHSYLQIMRRYLAQNTQDTQLAHLRGSLVYNGL